MLGTSATTMVLTWGICGEPYSKCGHVWGTRTVADARELVRRIDYVGVVSKRLIFGHFLESFPTLKEIVFGGQ